ncbi:MAG: hypothetical protein LBN40_01430 [Oscillospiraceae bacterium]|jgi:hypothetical protein|nr:hypothetical protein [Oscillospiraceae bacterium]
MKNAAESQFKATKKYNLEHYERIEFQIPRGTKANLKEYAKRKGLSVSAYIVQLIKNDAGEGILTPVENFYEDLPI